MKIEEKGTDEIDLKWNYVCYLVFKYKKKCIYYLKIKKNLLSLLSTKNIQFVYLKVPRITHNVYSLEHCLSGKNLLFKAQR